MPEIPADELDLERLPVILASVMAHQSDELYEQFQAGELFGRFAMTPFDEAGFSIVTVDGLPVASVHWTRLHRDVPFDLAADPPRHLGTVRRDDLPDDD